MINKDNEINKIIMKGRIIFNNTRECDKRKILCSIDLQRI